MEKKYLEVIYNGKLIGAFENVTKFEERENEIYLESDDGNYTIKRNTSLPEFYGKWFSPELQLGFDEYKLCGRRTLRTHTDNLNEKTTKQVSLQNIIRGNN